MSILPTGLIYFWVWLRPVRSWRYFCAAAIVLGPVRCTLWRLEIYWFHSIVGRCFRVCPLCEGCPHLGESVKGGSTVSCINMQLALETSAIITFWVSCGPIETPHMTLLPRNHHIYFWGHQRNMQTPLCSVELWRTIGRS